MQEYTQYKRGSEWRIWDLHIHTPGTKKNDRFEGSSLEDKWQNYINHINNCSEQVSVIGITDYLSIDNYFIFKDKVKEGAVTKVFDLIMPNVELRVLPVTGSATPINLHCIFNPSIDNELESRFFGKLKFNHGTSSYSATSSELRRFGRDFTGNASLKDEDALKKGIEQFIIQLDQLQEIFKNDPSLRDNTIVVVSNKSTDGASGVIKHIDYLIENAGSQLDATRQSIYQFSDAIFSSNKKDRDYFIGKSGIDSIDTVVKKYGSLKPCFHGCDAHLNDKIFKPDENRFCWIKSDPTFFGLKQVICEPEDRAIIQALKPEIKNDRYVISEIKFSDSSNLFGNQKILLNDNLNAVIGGKSSGKSLLLYYVANSIDPVQVSKTSKRLGFEGYKFSTSFNFEVVWKNGEVDKLNDVDPALKSRKITYIPQLYINYLAERNNKDELGKLIISILLQDPNFKSIYEESTTLIKDITSEINTLLSDYLEVRAKLIDLNTKSTELGKSPAIKKEIETITLSINDGQRSSNLSPEDFKIYNDLIQSKTKNEGLILDLSQKRIALGKIVTELRTSREDLFGNYEIDDDFPVRGKLDRILDEIIDLPQNILELKDKWLSNYDKMISSVENDIQLLKLSSSSEHFNELLAKVNLELQPFQLKIAGQQELQKLTKRLEVENNRLVQAVSLEKQIAIHIDEYNNLRMQTAKLIKKRFECYQSLVKYINENKSLIGTEIKLSSSLVYKKEDFILYEQVNKASLSKDSYFNSLFSFDFVNYEKVIELYEKQLKVSEEHLVIDKETKISLRQKISLEDVLRGLVKDCFSLDFNITYKGDNLLHMSPGKKGTVLLILFLQISSSEYPILIDQPEDNLDNRTIYDLLCKMIKEKKKERQIIIVSHNANLVVATDSENIIGANQAGQEAERQTSNYRFEYVNGSIEHSYSKDTAIKEILYQQGMKEHVCDILEGGNEAFKHRKMKYSIA
ncbi:TrlF family AAA-like ATPase [Rufibacter sp. XAAS-G3-1]|uniref:TrlF family AAA-like ATPase n=1 Tax=Rufibacter sp. XAAS-G3-1 TaxID=2729134 RepID=UPI0015E79E67|nr:hypothetical protein [Rufibacter sp. XAAS-G3-1]